MDDGIRVGLLGPLEVWRRERPVRVASALQRMLVARLALDPGRTVAVEALVDDLWEERPPADARGALQHHVSRLRKAIGPVVVTRGAGYLLEVEPDDVDALRFARLVRAGRTALRNLRQAVAVAAASGRADLALRVAGNTCCYRDLRVCEEDRSAEHLVGSGRGAQ